MKVKEVLITVNCTQVSPLGDRHNMEFNTIGNLYKKNESVYLVYKESKITGMEGTTTSLKIETDRVIINRMGQNQFKMIFEAGRDHDTIYCTPYGHMNAKVLTSEVMADLTELGGSINLKYELILDREKIGVNELLITVKEA